jgi:hypothetical protein
MGQTPILRKQRRLSWEKNASVLAWSDVNFDHHDRRTSKHLTSFCGDFAKKESRAGLANYFDGA